MQSKSDLKHRLIDLIYLASKELVIMDDESYSEVSLSLKAAIIKLNDEIDDFEED